ncbi:MAG: hypothetical protein BWY11_00280 [Firmicutes bacterium ADurb.Bin182]|nr:MAG: hypothetical protein BWY11_00280 [Firmicutes bacterium ADurb.Bin182]
MKKLLVVVLAVLTILSAASCQPSGGGKGAPESENLEGSLEDILSKIYETADVSDNFREWAKSGLETKDITAENVEYHLGTSDIEYEDAITSEPLMMPSAYSLCLLRLKEGADVEQIKSLLKEKADPRKWICVGVDPENVYVDSIGDVVMVVMSDEAGEALHNAFLALKG